MDQKESYIHQTKSSFFSIDNEIKYFVGLLQINGENIPFTWDDNLSLLKFILTLDNEIIIKQGIASANVSFLYCVAHRLNLSPHTNWLQL